MEYEFKCPTCDGNRLNEIMVNVTVDSEIDMVTDEDGIVYGDQTNGDGEVFEICCRSCGVILTNDGGVFRGSREGEILDCVKTHEELVEWLKTNNKVKEEGNDPTTD